jgi:hypothetical protein
MGLSGASSEAAIGATSQAVGKAPYIACGKKSSYGCPASSEAKQKLGHKAGGVAQPPGLGRCV